MCKEKVEKAIESLILQTCREMKRRKQVGSDKLARITGLVNAYVRLKGNDEVRDPMECGFPGAYEELLGHEEE